MNDANIETSKKIPWVSLAGTVAKVWVLFCIATFAMGVYFTHLNDHFWTILFAVIMGASYLFVIGGCIKLLVQRLPIAALMLLVPIAPLAVLILVVSLLPIIQRLR